ncbi:hypothetical protein PR202_gb26768 [Eleusine coracana subsp. coracana]|uniref:Glycosyltransferase n=1 Tax=Eleusine coracana subsp. coracana TaxID=191504 RepID=A0AAV5FTF6_ELECO|nr:hypothetical protein PR202_gb26768 [Eleusine coracana subsp. coracana]
MAAASKASGLDDGIPAVKVIKPGRCAFVHVFVALTFVAVPCVLLYAPRFSVPTPRRGAAGFVVQRVGSSGVVVDADEAHGGGVGPVVVLDNQVGSPCASMRNHAICCDRTDHHSDVCFMAGDVRTHAASLSLLLFPSPSAGTAAAAADEQQVVERIRPYTRKWDAFITKTIHEVTLRAARHHPDDDEPAAAARHCDVVHAAPAFVMTAGGYSHNLFHAFNDGFLPAWLTSQHLLRRRGVVLAVLGYNTRWAARFGELVAGLSSSSASAAHHHGGGVVDLVNDNRTHCFPGAIVGTRYHDYLAVDPARLRDNKTVLDFHDFLAAAYGPRAETELDRTAGRRPRVGIVSRRGRRVVENEAAVARLAASVGFDAHVINTGTIINGATPPLSALYKTVAACDALVGVHGADLTAFLFLRSGAAALVQVAPLGISLLSRNLFGVPAARMALRYEQYDVVGNESSLSRKYPPGHVVVADPARARREQGSKEWDLVEYVYLRGQNVSLDLGRFRETLARVHSWLMMQRRSALPAV